MEKYQLTFTSNFKKIGRILLFLSLPIILIVVTLIIDGNKFSYSNFISTASRFWVAISMISVITIPGILLHYKYYQTDKKILLELDKNFLAIHDSQGFTKTSYENILKAEVYTPAWSGKLPWSDYGFTRIFLRNGTQLLYTSLIFDCVSSKHLYKYYNVSVEEIETFWPWPNKKN